MQRWLSKGGMFVFLVFLAGVGCSAREGNVGNIQTFALESSEAMWIRNGEPIAFENQSWYPIDLVENFQNSEIIKMGEYQGVSFFIEKRDVRPFARLYTKFGRNQYRVFERRK